MKKKAYIAGKVTGVPRQQCLRKFAEQEAILRQQGWEVVNPMKIVPEYATWTEAMRICIEELKKCEAIYLLPCWITSTGACWEYIIAKELNLLKLNH